MEKNKSIIPIVSHSFGTMIYWNMSQKKPPEPSLRAAFAAAKQSLTKLTIKTKYGIASSAKAPSSQ
jgi:hypothetical protein